MAVVLSVLSLGRGALNESSGCNVPAPQSWLLQHTSYKIVVEVKASGPPHVLKLWFGLSKGILSVKYICYTKTCFVSFEFNRVHESAYKDEVTSCHHWFKGYDRI